MGIKIIWFLIVRYYGMNKHSIPFYSVFYLNLKFSGEENQGQGHYEGNVTSEVRFLEVLLLLYFPGDYLSKIIKIPSNVTNSDFAPHTILHAHVRIS
jgi:hypothetical protein